MNKWMDNWTETEKKTLWRLHNERYTFCEMAAILGRTRNAIAGQVRRMKLVEKRTPYLSRKTA